MYKRYYDGYNNIPQNCDKGEILIPEKVCNTPNDATVHEICTNCRSEDLCCSKQKSFLNLPCEIDDIILIGVLLFLLLDKENINNGDGGNDIFMLLIIGFILFADIF